MLPPSSPEMCIRDRYADIKRAVALDPVDYEAEYDAAMARRDMCAGNSFG